MKYILWCYTCNAVYPTVCCTVGLSVFTGAAKLSCKVSLETQYSFGKEQLVITLVHACISVFCFMVIISHFRYRHSFLTCAEGYVIPKTEETANT